MGAWCPAGNAVCACGSLVMQVGCGGPLLVATAAAPHRPSPSRPPRAAGDGQRHHFLSRFFGPWAGIAEDPVTGSAHSVLGPYWARRLGTPALRARQCSARGGELRVDVRADEGRVTVAGQAAMVLTGQLLLPSAS